LKTVQVGNKELKNIEATVVENPNAACLLGQTVLSRFGKYTIFIAKPVLRGFTFGLAVVIVVKQFATMVDLQFDR